jgi:type IV pilus assembly protein PilM
MGLFSTPNSYIGVDFDSNSVKVVELKNENHRPKLVTYGYYDKKTSSAQLEIDAKNKNSVANIAEAIKQVCKHAGVTSNQAVTSLPAYSVFSSVLTLPALKTKDLASAVKWEAKKVVPLPIEEMTLDWKIIEQVANEKVEEDNGQNQATNDELNDKREFTTINQQGSKQYVKVLLTAAPKDLVKRYIDIFRAAGLTLLSLDTESFALIRSLVGNDRSALMIVDIGSAVTTISIVNKGIPMLTRSIDVGGLTVTRSIANSLNITVERAEQLKYDIGLAVASSGQGSVPQTIESSLIPIVDEIQYSLNLYASQGKQKIEKVILTGGSSLLHRLPEYLGQALQLRVFVGDPWARVIHPQELKPVLDSIGPRFSVGVGLAMRDIT